MSGSFKSYDTLLREEDEAEHAQYMQEKVFSRYYVDCLQNAIKQKLIDAVNVFEDKYTPLMQKIDVIELIEKVFSESK